MGTYAITRERESIAKNHFYICFRKTQYNIVPFYVGTAA